MKLEELFGFYPCGDNTEILKNMNMSNPYDVNFENGIVTSYRGTKLDPYEHTNAYIERRHLIPQLLENVGILPMPAWRLVELEMFYNGKSNCWLELKALEVFGEHLNVINDGMTEFI